MSSLPMIEQVSDTQVKIFLTSVLDEPGQITSFAVLKDEVEVVFVLGGAKELDYKRVVHLIQ